MQSTFVFLYFLVTSIKLCEVFCFHRCLYLIWFEDKNQTLHNSFVMRHWHACGVHFQSLQSLYSFLWLACSLFHWNCEMKMKLVTLFLNFGLSISLAYLEHWNLFIWLRTLKGIFNFIYECFQSVWSMNLSVNDSYWVNKWSVSFSLVNSLHKN